MMVYPTRAHRRLELRAMGRALASADAVVLNTEEAARRALAAFPRLREKVVRAVPNAFEPADFEGPPPTREDGRFRIVHTGSLHTEQGRRLRARSAIRRLLGGAVNGVDVLPRSHVFLVQALERLLAKRPELRELVDLHFVGVLTPDDRSELGSLPYVTLPGFLPHDETVVLIRSADLLFLPMHDLPAGRRATIVPHKTYEYFASGRPILAAVPDGDARDLLDRAGTARLSRPSDVGAIAHALELEIARWESGADAPSPDPDVLESCAAPRLAGDVAAVFDELVSYRH
jgi:glycosyltransferase involved in cell wall biosynthesis